MSQTFIQAFCFLVAFVLFMAIVHDTAIGENIERMDELEARVELLESSR